MTALPPPTAPSLASVREVDDDGIRDLRRGLRRAVDLASLALDAQSPTVRAETITRAVECAHEALRMMGRQVGAGEVGDAAEVRHSER